MRIVLITGISGSGKSVALNVLEDAGYYCVDNLPPALLPALVKTVSGDESNCMAVAVDARSAQSLTALPGTVSTLREEGHQVKVIFLTSSTHSLVARFSETRRSHPLSHELRPGENPASRPLTPPDVCATILQAAGITRTDVLALGLPVEGEPVHELF